LFTCFDHQKRFVAHLFGQLLLAEFVQSVELLREDDVLDETARREFDPDDDAAVRNHHGHWPENDFQVFRQFLTSGVTRVLKKN